MSNSFPDDSPILLRTKNIPFFSRFFFACSASRSPPRFRATCDPPWKTRQAAPAPFEASRPAKHDMRQVGFFSPGKKTKKYPLVI